MRHDFVGAGLEQREDLLVRHRRRDDRSGGGRSRRRLQALAGFGVIDVARDDAAVRTGAVDARRAQCRLPWPDAGRAATRTHGRGRWLAGRQPPPAARQPASARRGGFWRRRGGGRRSGSRWRGGARADFAARRSRCSCRLHVLAVAGQDRDDVVDRHVLRALGHQDLRDRALVDGFDFHRRLVGLDLRDHVAGLDLVALFLEPLGKVALFHRGRQRGHQNVDRHCQ